MSFVAVGVDAGATKTEIAVAGASSHEPRITTHRGTNATRFGVDHAVAALTDAITDVLGDGLSEDDVILVCAGVAGAGRTSIQAEIATRLNASLALPAGSLTVRVVGDGLIALQAALGDGSGSVVVTGTGSIVVARLTDGLLLRTGGWGFALGDPGSGHSIAMAALKHVAMCIDQGRHTRLSLALSSRFSIAGRDDLIALVYGDRTVIHAAAPLVVDMWEDGSDVAGDILKEQAKMLSEDIFHMATLAARRIEKRLAFVGGMTNHRSYLELLGQVACARVPDWRVVPPRDAAPAVGALELALQQRHFV